MVHSPGFLRFNVMNGECNTSNTYNDGQWHYAVGTWDGSNVRLYVDGQLDLILEFIDSFELYI